MTEENIIQNLNETDSENIDIQNLISRGLYRKIVDLKNHKFNREKIIAFIKLEKYHDAYIYLRSLRKDLSVLDRLESLRLTGNIAFEEAYILYKLKKYKKSLKVLKSVEESERKNILLSQVLYFLRRYDQAYEILSKCKYEKERDINLLTMEILHERSLKKKQPIKKIEYNFGSSKKIADYNRSFADFQSYNPSRYVAKYHNVKNERIESQIGNLLGLLKPNDFKGKKRQIIEHNLQYDNNFKKELIHKDFGEIIQIFHKESEIEKLRDPDLKNALLFLKGATETEEIKQSIERIFNNE